MKPTSFKETNHLLGAGNNPGTGDLPIARSLMDIEGRPFPCIISCWKLSPEELELIQQTGKVWIAVMGVGSPPIMPMISHPFADLGIKPIDI
jgi:hypothetical protein